MRNKALIIGPLPPAIGGVATIVGLLKNSCADKAGIVFIDTSKPAGRLAKLLRPIKLLVKIGLAASGSRDGTVLMFSSAYGSFWEKCTWSLLCKAFGMRTVVQMVDGNFPRFHERLSRPLRWLARMVIGNVDVIVAQSLQWKGFYEAIFPESVVKAVSPGIDTDFFTPPRNRAMNGPVKVLYVGWLTEEKGIYDLLDATRLVARTGLAFILRLIGPDFGNKRNIREYAKRLGLETVIEIIEPIHSRKMLREAYQFADIFVFPSHFEGFPYALMEAIASGLSCIGTRVGGIPDILDNGACGLIVEKKAPAQLGEALCKLIKDEKLRLTLGERARRRAVSEYSLQKSLGAFRAVMNIEN